MAKKFASNETITKAELEFIRENAGKMPVKEIAQHLGKRSLTIIEVIQAQKLIQDNGATSNDKVRIIEVLKARPFYRSLIKQLNSEELEIFIEDWVDTICQFQEDLLPTEEAQVRDLIIINIMKNRILQENRDIIDRRTRFESDLKREESLKDPDQAKIRFWRGEISGMHNVLDRNLKSFAELLTKAESARQKLNASRDSRIKKIDDAKQNFTNWLRMISEYENKAQVGREMDLMRQALEKQEREMGEFYEYADNRIDVPVLNHLTVEDKEFDMTELEIIDVTSEDVRPDIGK